MAKTDKTTWYGKAKAQAQGLRCVIAVSRAYPSTFLWPLLLFAVLCGVGVWAVTRGAQLSADSAKAKADFLARDAATEYRQLLSAAFSLTKVLASLVGHDPQYGTVAQLFNATAPGLLQAAAVGASAVHAIELIPSGVIRLVYPAHGNQDIVGLDLFGVPDPDFVAAVRASVSSPGLALEGPMEPLKGSSVTGLVLVVRESIYAPAIEDSETFGRPDAPNPSCGAPCSYNATTGTKFWGLAGVIIYLDELLSPLGVHKVSAPLRTLAAMGYRYELVAPIVSAGIRQDKMVVVEGSPLAPGDAAVEADVDLSGVQWIVRVGPSDSSWMPAWYGGVLAVAVVVSLAAALLLFFLMVSRRRNRMLLKTLLPTELIRDLQAEHAETSIEPRHLTSESPADLLLDLLGALLEGQPADLRDVVLLRTVLRRHVDVYQPLNLGGRIREANLDNEVASALMRQLGDVGDMTTGVGGGIGSGGSNTWDVPMYSKVGRARGPGSNAASSNTGELLLSTAQQREQQLAAECQTMQGALAYILYDKDPEYVASSVPGSFRRPNDVDDDMLDESAFGSVTLTGAGVGADSLAVPATPGSSYSAATAAMRPAAAANGALLAAGSCGQLGLPPPVQRQLSGSRSRLGSGSGFSLRAGGSITAGEGSLRRGGSPLALNRCVVVLPDNGAGGVDVNTAALANGSSGGSGTGDGARLSKPRLPAAIRANGEDAGVSTQGSQLVEKSSSGPFNLPAALRSLASRRKSMGPTRVDGESPRLLLQGNLTAAAAAMAASRGGGSGGSVVEGGDGEAAEVNGRAFCGEVDSASVVIVQAAERAAAPSVPGHTLRSCAPAKPLLEEVERMLAICEEWQFDTWGLQEASGGHALSCMGFYLFRRTGLVERFKLEPVTLARLLRQIEAGYPATNPYHNAAHAADVLRTLHVLLHGAKMTAHYVDSLGLLGCYFAAIIHDYGHPGLTNDFLIASGHSLALRYNDRSPLESHHAASAFTLLAERPDLDVMAGLSRQDRAAVRKQVIEMVLATDMKQHFAILKHFTTVHRLSSNSNGPQQHTSHQHPTSQSQQQQHHAPNGGVSPPPANAVERISKNKQWSGNGTDVATSGPDPANVTVPVPVDESERLLSLQVALKVADIGHLGAELEKHERWLGALEEEFFRQGDQERDLGLPISPLFDRSKQGVSKSQVGFYDFVALPLVRAVAGAFPGAGPLLRCFQANYYHWREVEGAAAAAAAAPAPASSPSPTATATVTAVSSPSAGATQPTPQPPPEPSVRRGNGAAGPAAATTGDGKV